MRVLSELPLYYLPTILLVSPSVSQLVMVQQYSFHIQGARSNIHSFHFTVVIFLSAPVLFLLFACVVCVVSLLATSVCAGHSFFPTFSKNKIVRNQTSTPLQGFDIRCAHTPHTLTSNQVDCTAPLNMCRVPCVRWKCKIIFLIFTCRPFHAYAIVLRRSSNQCSISPFQGAACSILSSSISCCFSPYSSLICILLYTHCFVVDDTSGLVTLSHRMALRVGMPHLYAFSIVNGADFFSILVII